MDGEGLFFSARGFALSLNKERSVKADQWKSNVSVQGVLCIFF